MRSAKPLVQRRIEAIEGHLAPPIATERAVVLLERLRVMAGV
jgi:hypothetical protein